MNDIDPVNGTKRQCAATVGVASGMIANMNSFHRPCKCNALPGKEHCAAHDEETQRERSERARLRRIAKKERRKAIRRALNTSNKETK